MELGISGLASGFDWRSLVDQLTDVERSGQRRLRSEQSGIQQRNNAYSSIRTQLSTLKTRADTLKDSSLFDNRTVTSSDTTVGTASAANAAAIGSYRFVISQLATAATRNGASNAGAALSATDDVSTLTLSSAGFSTPVTAGDFTVNGKRITVAVTDTLQNVFDRISTQTGGAVTAAYSASTDRISLTGTGEIVLGSVNDTSNFLQTARLSNNGTGSVTSASSLGGVKLTTAMASANFATPVSDGGAGAGSFKINGVSISFNTSSDGVQNVLDRINASTAGVTASYDAVQDRFQLTNKSTGDVGVALEDITGNFLAATGLSAGSLVRGKDMAYTVNGGSTLTSRSNTIDSASSGITGLTLNVAKEGTVTANITSDTGKIKTAIGDFIAEYNRVQSLISSQTASTTDASGKVTAGLLTGESDPSELSRTLRNQLFSSITGLSGSISHIAALGYDSSGTDDSLTLDDATALDQALTNNLSSVKDLFANATSGIAVKASAFLENTIGDNGTLTTKQSALTKLSSAIDTQVSDQERVVQSNRQRLIDSFIVMEKVQAQVNQQLQFLTKRFG